MNPKPFASLNHFTVPVAMSFPFLKLQLCARLSEPRCGHDHQRKEWTATRKTAYGDRRDVRSLTSNPAGASVTRRRHACFLRSAGQTIATRTSAVPSIERGLLGRVKKSVGPPHASDVAP